MKPKILLDTVYIIRLLKNDLFEKAMKNISIFITPTVINEITSPNYKSYLNQLITRTEITLINLDSEIYKKNISNLYKKHRGKDHEMNYRRSRLKKLRDLGEFEIFSFLIENPNFLVLTFDKGAKKIIRIEYKIKNCLIPEDREQGLLGFTDEEMKKLRRGYSS